jgi:WhiB family redox-sensing transcriptional regulator
MGKGNCTATKDPDLFFCGDEEHPKLEPTPLEQAVITAYCLRCPVRVTCLKYALDDPKVVGIWGGTTTMQRRTMRRGRKRSSCLKCRSQMVATLANFQACRSCGTTWRWS